MLLIWLQNGAGTMLECDSLAALTCLHNKDFAPPWRLRSQWLNCLAQIKQMVFYSSHIYREGNVAADLLANMGLAQPNPFWWDHPPLELRKLLTHDTRGTTVFGCRDPTLVPSSRESLPTSNNQSIRINWTHAAKYTLKKDQARPPLIMEARSEKADQKSSVYDVATQLKSIPAQISIWELLSTLEAHRESFIRVLRNAHVPEKTSPETLSQMIAQILAPKIITFSDDELSVEGRHHVRPLNIPV